MILTLDLGSSSTRAALYDERANAIPGASGRAPMSFAVGDDGRHEDNVEAAFKRVISVLDELHSVVNDLSSIAVHDLGISSYAASLVCLDECGTPLTPIYTYADTRCAEDARRLREQYDEIEALQRTGCRIRANYLPAKLMWIKRTMPDVFRRTRWFVSLSDAVCLRLFGRMRAGISIVSWTGLLNRQTSNWDERWLDALGVSLEKLPPIAGDDEMLNDLLPEWASRWPKFKDIRCYPPVGDGAVANVGSGCVDASHIAVTIGSTAAIRLVRPLTTDKRLPAALWAYRVDHAHELIGGATTEGGNVFAWARQTLNLPDEEAIEEKVGEMQPDAHGLIVLPTFGGERSPGYAENIHATLHGLSFDTTSMEIVRALMEGIAYRLAHVCDAIREAGLASEDATLVASGGALQASPNWCQIIADATGMPMQLADVPEATSRGVAMLVAGNWLTVNQQPTTNTQRFEPDAKRHHIYRAAMARQGELYAKLVRSDR